MTMRLLSALRAQRAARRGIASNAPVAPTPLPPGDGLARIDAVLDGIADPLLLVEGGRVIVANRAALALLGRHVVGQDARLAIRHPDAAAALAGEVAPGDAAIMLEGLGALDQLWEMRVGTAGDGARIVQLTDRSAGRAADRMRTDFVANASHELRTPLASILGYVETLQGDAGEAPPVRARFLGIVLDEAKRMQRLVQDLMSLSRIEADRYRLPARHVDLAAVIAEVAIEIRAAHPTPPLEIAVAGPLPAVIGDPPQLSQLLHNLVGNARAYGRAGEPVAVTAAAADGGIRLGVADRGDGIAPEHLPRLTERFYRVDAARSRAAAGTGLGLAIVKHIVERHRGRLGIASTLGVGTTVSVWLPAAPNAAGPAVTEA